MGVGAARRFHGHCDGPVEVMAFRVVHAIRINVLELEVDSAGKVHSKRSSLSHYRRGLAGGSRR